MHTINVAASLDSPPLHQMKKQWTLMGLKPQQHTFLLNGIFALKCLCYEFSAWVYGNTQRNFCLVRAKMMLSIWFYTWRNNNVHRRYRLDAKTAEIFHKKRNSKWCFFICVTDCLNHFSRIFERIRLSIFLFFGQNWSKYRFNLIAHWIHIPKLISFESVFPVVNTINRQNTKMVAHAAVY